MSRISITTRSVVKEQIMGMLNKDTFQSTFSIAEKIGRSWEFTLSLLNELKTENKVIESRVSHLRVWKLGE